jgi:hypothetical protein
MSAGYTIKRKSNYDGFKALDRILEGVDTGRLNPAANKKNRDPVHDIYCPLCHYRKKSRVFVRSELLGTRMPEMPFRVKAALAEPFSMNPRLAPTPWEHVPKGLIVCAECAAPLQRSASDEALTQWTEDALCR